MKKKSINHLHKIFSLFLLILLGGIKAFSQDFYWEKPVSITTIDSRYPKTLNYNDKAFIFYQEVDSKNRQIYLSSRNYSDLETFIDNPRFAGPFSYSGENVPDLFSVAINKKGKLVIAALDSIDGIYTYISDDFGNTFTKNKISSQEIMIAPRIYADTQDNFRLFTSVGGEISFSIYSSISSDGKNWEPFEEFAGAKNMRLPFTPVLVSYQFQDYVVFQAQYLIPGQQKTSYQLYLTRLNPETLQWSEPVLISNEQSYFSRERKHFYDYANQRPNLFVINNKLYITWERSESSNSAIYYAELSSTGINQKSLDLISDKGNASRGILFGFNGDLYTTWFDDRRGNESVYYAKRTGNMWNDKALVADSNSNLYVYPLLIKEKGSNAKNLSFVYQQVTIKGKNSISLVAPDKHVNKPTITPQNFRLGRHAKVLKPEVKINFPEDSSGIRGYSYSWSQNEKEEPLTLLTNTTKENKLSVNANYGDGNYYLKVRVQDKAGNWSDSASITYYLDTTPPKAPKISKDIYNDFNILKSNSFQFTWDKSEDEDAVSYLYSIDKICDIPRIMYESKRHPIKISQKRLEEETNKLEQRFESEKYKYENRIPKTSTKSLNTKRFYNNSNGLYVISVSAIDDVGNISPPNLQMFILNKFEPSTYITSITKEETQTFDTILTIYGGGFTYDGTITQVILDLDGAAPYDLVLESSKNQFKVVNNSKIINVNIGTDLEEGNYKVILNHSDRGLYRSTSAVKILQRGTVKIEPEYVLTPKYSQDFIHLRYKLSIYLVLISLMIAFGFVGVLFITYNLQKSISQQSVLSLEVQSLLTGGPMPTQSPKNKKRQKSLKSILVRFTYFLIVAIVLSVSLKSGYNDIKLQKSTLSSALEERSQVLLESLTANVRSFMPSENKTEIAALTSLKDAMKEAQYVTIIGQKSGSLNNQELNYVWASDDPDIREKINDASINYGYSKIEDETVDSIVKSMLQIETIIKSQVLSLEEEIARIDNDLRNKNPETDSDFEELSEQKAKFISQINTKLQEQADLCSGSIPYFNNALLSIRTSEYDYIFYRPVLYRQGNSRQYIHSVIIMKISIESLIHAIQNETRNIIISAVIIALIAVIAGLIGSFLFASVIIKPVKILEEFVDRFGRAKVKKSYNKTTIKIKDKKAEKLEKKEKSEQKEDTASENNPVNGEEDSKKKKNKKQKKQRATGEELIVLKDDEIGRLGIAINRMKDQIINNEIEMGLQLDGSEVQNSFLPLEKGTSYSKYEDENIQSFGYYQAQTGVSGDCFDYKKLDDSWYIFLKSDASGHGSPAAFIMTVVATFFKEYVNNWSFKKNGTNINDVVYKINDFIFSLGLRGKFATMLVALFNHKTGDLYLCNAGDNLVNIYREKQHKVEVLTLNSCPTTGVFDSDMIRMGTGYKVEKNKLEKGDILFLYTDGIEESTRRMRNADFSVQQTQTESLKMNEETHKRETVIKLEDKKEEFGPDRVRAVLEAVFNKRKFELTKDQNPMTNETLEFDFTKSDSSLHDAIFALAACEKVFRFYKPAGLQSGVDYIEIDKEIDIFLEKYFNLYSSYAKLKEQSPEKENFFTYDLIMEDEQGDDLTLLAMKRI